MRANLCDCKMKARANNVEQLCCYRRHEWQMWSQIVCNKNLNLNCNKSKRRFTLSDGKKLWYQNAAGANQMEQLWHQGAISKIYGATALPDVRDKCGS